MGSASARFPPSATLRVSLGLRDERARRPQRQRRMAMPTADGLAERLRSDPLPRRRRLPPGSLRRERPGRTPLHPRDDGARDGCRETRMGWVIVRDVLCIGPWHHDDERCAFTPPLAH